MYGIDKSAARQGSLRISESTLNLIAFFGGWPGGLFGQQYFCHKTRKKTFLRGFWIAVLLNCVGFAWFITPNGIEALSLAELKLQSVICHVDDRLSSDC